MHEVDCVVIGAGVVGLAVARAFAQAGREVFILEKEHHFGFHSSSRNSEVIHSGLYYPPGSLKARTCVDGRRQLYQYCRERGIRHRQCGKLVVATDARQLESLERIAAVARCNGIDDLEWMDAVRARREEPQLECVAALWSPSTGIIDSHEYLLALLGDAQVHGANLICDTEVVALRSTGSAIDVTLAPASTPSVRCRTLINAAGLGAVRVACGMVDFPAACIPPMHYAKGNYFALAGRAPFGRLVYPVPEDGGLGVHMTLDIAGAARFGPDVEWVTEVDYGVDPGRAAAFGAAIRRYWPGFDPGRLRPAYAGIRPKLSARGEPAADFRVSGPAEHGVPGLVHLFGIESPGLTASLALAAHVAASGV